MMNTPLVCWEYMILWYGTLENLMSVLTLIAVMNSIQKVAPISRLHNAVQVKVLIPMTLFQVQIKILFKLCNTIVTIMGIHPTFVQSLTIDIIITIIMPVQILHRLEYLLCNMAKFSMRLSITLWF